MIGWLPGTTIFREGTIIGAVQARCAAGWALAATAIVALGACAGPTPYQRRNAGEGYHDYEIRRGVYAVSFDGNGRTPRDLAITYWHRRAAEICGGPDRYEVLGMDASGRKVFPPSPTVIREYTLPHVEGLIRCK